MNRLKLVYIPIILLLLTLPLSSQAGREMVGTSSASFLKIGVGARAAGMGGAFSAVSDDATSIHWNPAGLGFLERKEISYMHNLWFQEIIHGFLGYAHPFAGENALGMGVEYLTMGEIEETTEDEPRGTGKKLRVEDDIAYVLSYGRRIGSDLSMGVNLKHIQQKIADLDAYGLGADLGILYRLPNASFALVIQNLGPEIKFEKEKFPLPFNIKGGVGYRGISNTTLALDINIPRDNDISLQIGGEYWIANLLAIRAGYNSKISGNRLGTFNLGEGISAGFGISLGTVQMDAAYVPYGDLGDTYKVSLLMRFGVVEAKERVEPPEPEEVEERPEKAEVEEIEPPKVVLEKEVIEVVAGGLRMEIRLLPHPEYVRFHIKIRNVTKLGMQVSPYDFLLLTEDGEYHSVTTEGLEEEDLLMERGLGPNRVMEGHIFFKTNQPPKKLIYEDYLGNSMAIVF